ncbi:1,5-anhydro-D-fructose reductase isoform X2 [Cervus elaphus]|uniref:1,5-anhydro-D-fructose reductase isoform X2 n=1 Tax=Cervus elaphus TaxID=9860 RepID=UPI001CC2B683|nr:1,5-anhydro-D-fructose reductase isoform X2 [Cervus elaphus]
MRSALYGNRSPLMRREGEAVKISELLQEKTVRVSSKRTVLTWSREMAWIWSWRNPWKRLNKQGSKAVAGEVTEAVKVAIDVGYRHVDCAYVYHNENEVGVGVQSKIKEGVVRRENLFIVSKLWCTCHKKPLVKAACTRSLKALKLDYLDLYLMHWPMGFKSGEADLPMDHNGMIIPSNTDFLDTWEAMENLVAAGLVRAIGVSNFNHEQLERILNKPNLRFKPVTNQWGNAPDGGPYDPDDRSEAQEVCSPDFDPISDPEERKSDSQICQPKADSRELPGKCFLLLNHMVFDFELSEEDMTDLLGLDRNLRLATFPITENHKDYPFRTEF